MANIKNKQNKITTVSKAVEKLEPLCAVNGNENDAATMENSVSVLKKLKIGLPYDLAIPLLGIYPKEVKADSQK